MLEDKRTDNGHGGFEIRESFFFAGGATVLTLTKTMPLNGMVKEAILDAPACLTNPTVTLKLNDGTYDTYDSTALADGTIHLLTPNKIFTEEITISLSLFAAPGGPGYTFNIVLKGE